MRCVTMTATALQMRHGRIWMHRYEPVNAPPHRRRGRTSPSALGNGLIAWLPCVGNGPDRVCLRPAHALPCPAMPWHSRNVGVVIELPLISVEHAEDAQVYGLVAAGAAPGDKDETHPHPSCSHRDFGRRVARPPVDNHNQTGFGDELRGVPECGPEPQ